MQLLWNKSLLQCTHARSHAFWCLQSEKTNGNKDAHAWMTKVVHNLCQIEQLCEWTDWTAGQTNWNGLLRTDNLSDRWNSQTFFGDEPSMTDRKKQLHLETLLVQLLWNKSILQCTHARSHAFWCLQSEKTNGNEDSHAWMTTTWSSNFWWRFSNGHQRANSGPQCWF